MASTAVNAHSVSDLMMNIEEEIFVNASLEQTFEALLEQLGPELTDGKGNMHMKLEAWPGGRWFRDLGNGNGHLWAHVQSIKRPTLLEFYGPLMMSFPVNSNVQYRLTEQNGGTLIKFHHYALGVVPDNQRQGLKGGWSSIHERIRKAAEGKRV
jgi:hypothetical protein